MNCLTQFNSAQLETIHKGKVRDSIRIDDDRRLIVVTDRLSAFNKVLKTPIPTKGAVLNGIANFWFDQTKHILDNHVIKQVDPCATLVKEAEPIRVEMVVRGYLTGSMWRGYAAGQRQFSGVVVGEGLQKTQAFEQPILTPTTKDKDDTAIDEQGILEAGLVRAAVYDQMKEKALALFAFGSNFLKERGIILVDTKYEFGLLDGQLILIDEIHTPDSSRFWNAADYAEHPAEVEQMDKEFVRQWMLRNKIDGEVPSSLSKEVIEETSRRYQDIYKTIVGQPLELPDTPIEERLHNNLIQHGLIAS
jgi:phosphoribosylaminoimidazole-succinocarboxamide synthase